MQTLTIGPLACVAQKGAITTEYSKQQRRVLGAHSTCSGSGSGGELVPSVAWVLKPHNWHLRSGRTWRSQVPGESQPQEARAASCAASNAQRAASRALAMPASYRPGTPQASRPRRTAHAVELGTRRARPLRGEAESGEEPPRLLGTVSRDRARHLRSRPAAPRLRLVPAALRPPALRAAPPGSAPRPWRCGWQPWQRWKS
eukprot:scaffold33153_cov44-Phaeocystis_antarctica.AAC.2